MNNLDRKTLINRINEDKKLIKTIESHIERKTFKIPVGQFVEPKIKY